MATFPNVLDLPDDLLDIIILHAEEFAPFLAGVCLRFARCERCLRIENKRLCEIHCAFRSTETLLSALKNESFFNLVKTCGNGWTNAAHVAAIRSGSQGVLSVVFGRCPLTPQTIPGGHRLIAAAYSRVPCTSAYLRHASFWNRLDILIHNTNFRGYCESSMRTLACQNRPNRETREMPYMQGLGGAFAGNFGGYDLFPPSRSFLSHVVVPAFWGGSLSILKWLFSMYRATRLGQDSAWSHLLLCRTSRLPRVLVRAAQSSANSEEALEYLACLLHEALRDQPIARVRLHVAAVAISMARQSVSVGTLRFGKRYANDLLSLMGFVNRDIVSGTSFIHRRDSLVSACTFMLATKNVHAYEWMRAEVGPGGWLNEAMCDCTASPEVEKLLRGPNAAFYVDWMVLENVWNVPRFPVPQSTLEIAKTALVRCVDSHFAMAYPPTRTITREIDALASHSPSFAHNAIVKMICNRKGKVGSLDNILYGEGGAILLVLYRAVVMECKRVVFDMLNSRITPIKLSKKDAAHLVEIAATRDSKVMTEIIVQSNKVVPRLSAVEKAAKQGRSEFLHVVLKHFPKLACEQVGKAAQESNSPETVHVALCSGCFLEGSEEERIATLFIASQHNAPRRRRLPPTLTCGHFFD